MIRRAEAADIPRLVDMGRAFHEASGISCPYDTEATAALLGTMIANDRATVLVTDGGTIGGVLSPAYCAPQWIMAVEMFWWAGRDGLALLRAFEKWAGDMGANEVRMTSLASLPRAARVLAHRGYTATEISYAKVI